LDPEVGTFDVVSVGELVVDFISAEQTDTLGNAFTFRRYLGGSPTYIAVYVSKLGGKCWEECLSFAHEVATLELGDEGHAERMVDRHALYERLETSAGQRA
jgi:sugar/nucleoside kinase (ribokinase family)